MNKDVPRLRMFAGPEWIGQELIQDLVSIFIPMKEISDRGFLDLDTFQITMDNYLCPVILFLFCLAF
jgi:hypothetical protein